MNIAKLKCNPIPLALRVSDFPITWSHFRGRAFIRSAFSLPVLSRRSEPLVTGNTTHAKTLSVVSSPWSVESWNLLSKEKFEGEKFSFSSLASSTLSETVLPKSTTTMGIPSQSSTVVIGVSKRNKPKTPMRITQQTISSWSSETFICNEPASSKPGSVKVKYPWSPASSLSDSDFYPSSTMTLASRKESKSTMVSEQPSALHGPSHSTHGSTAPNAVNVEHELQDDPMIDIVFDGPVVAFCDFVIDSTV
ncbi:unnamed protein product [Arctia plantaginis]|uniref:Uncharacterized protein n=1 Tax=Arctia plantaginis TaxID=874455 RepID=A0A8S1ASP0_ARCPL|nr:unnamed protein product [Arctia plantaginis]